MSVQVFLIIFLISEEEFTCFQSTLSLGFFVCLGGFIFLFTFSFGGKGWYFCFFESDTFFIYCLEKMKRFTFFQTSLVGAYQSWKNKSGSFRNRCVDIT